MTVPLAGAAGAAAAAACLAALWLTSGAAGADAALDLRWLPALGSRFTLRLDALAAPLAVSTCGLLAAVLVFTAGYLPHYLREHDLGGRAPWRFCGLMLGFGAVMVLLLAAQDLLAIFLALELTALASFLLIRFDDDDRQARAAARTALVVTAGSSLLFLIGLLTIAARIGSTTLAVAAERAAEVPPLAVWLLVAGVIGKSAQVPLHFWLPRAMVAATPVSAYLHSATLVAAGVFVLQRLRFLLETAPGLLDALFWFAFLSIAVGGLLALLSDAFKRILAYSTVAQYGYAVAMIGAGGEHGAIGAPFFLVAHGLAKCALFMTAGAVTTATGEDRLSHSGGLARAMPWLAAGSALAAAALAGLPFTIGFFKDDLLVKAALARGGAAPLLVAVALALTFAYTARFWFGIFGGASRERRRPGALLSAPVLALGLLSVAGGLWLAPLEAAFGPAGTTVLRHHVEAHFAYEWGPAPGVAALGWMAGAVLVLATKPLNRVLAGPVAQASRWLGAASWSDRAAAAGTRLSMRLHEIEVRDMRDRFLATLAPTAFFVVLGLWQQGTIPAVGGFDGDRLPLFAALALCVAAALAATRPLGHVAFVLVLSFVGFSLALLFALAHAPDVALVLVLIETAFTLLFLALLWHVRPEVLRTARERMPHNRGPAAGILAGVAGFATAWVALSTSHDRSTATSQIALTDTAHAKDVVTAILADFRGLDTAGEVTVLVVAIFGAAATAWGRQR